MSDQGTQNNIKIGGTLPPIPDKIYFTIGEVGRLCKLKPHVLRYWEQEFSLLSPIKRRGNRRYYQHKDVLLVRNIRKLLYDEGYTIDGARQQLQSLLPEANDNCDGKLSAVLQLAIAELEKVAKNLRQN